jgi:peptidoglycan/xylan/chitin deacetylase (PgdA/CDA1 family)
MYHRVLTDSDLSYSFSNPGIIVNDKTFDSHTAFLKKYFNIISIDHLAAHLKDGAPLKNFSCLITFDDGWIDNYTNALPILSKHNVPALIFLPVDYIGSDEPFWQETLASLIYHIADARGDHQRFLVEQGVTMHGSLALKSRRKTIYSYIASLKKQSNAQIDAVIDKFKTYSEMHRIQRSISSINVDRYIDWQQILTMSNCGISFGSHAISHRLLTKLDGPQVEHELTKSKKVLTSHLGKNTDSIAYPNGDFNDSVIKQVENCGYLAGFTTNHGYFHAGNDPYKINRINIHQAATGNIPMFFCRLLGIF